MNPVDTLLLYIFKIHLNIIIQSNPTSFKWSLASSFRTKTLHLLSTNQGKNTGRGHVEEQGADENIGPRKEEVTIGWGQFHNEKLHQILLEYKIKEDTMGEAYRTQIRHAYKILV
jgi:hypothetical protein